MVAFILVCLVLLLGLLWGWEIRKRKSLEQEFVKNLKSASNLNGNLNCSKELEHYAS